jgi:hypothetical protein
VSPTLGAALAFVGGPAVYLALVRWLLPRFGVGT